jgi:hypothetical protein
VPGKSEIQFVRIYVWRNLASLSHAHVLRIADDAPFELSAHRSTFGVGGEYSFSTSDALLINCLHAVESGHWILSAELPSNEGFLADRWEGPLGHGHVVTASTVFENH